MTRIELVANDQLLQVTVSPKISSGEVNTVSIHVDFSDEWNNFGKNAVFYTSYNSRDIYEIVMTNDECIVPSEVMTKSGTLYIGVRGVNSNKNEVKTTSLVKLKISEGTPTGNSTEVEPTPDVYQQLLTAYGKTDNSINKEITDRKSAISTEKAERQAEIAVERARIDKLSTLEAGSTTGDAELIDGRIDFNGTVYNNIGSHIREVTKNLNTTIYEASNTLQGDLDSVDLVLNPSLVENSGYYYNDDNGANIDSNANFCYTDPIEVKKGDEVELVGEGYNTSVSMICLCDANNSHRMSVYYSSNSSVNTYRYTATMDCYLTFSYKQTSKHSLKIYKKSKPIVIDDVVNESPCAIETIKTYISLNGTLTSHPNYCISSLIQLKRNDELKFSISCENTASALSLCDSSGSFVKSLIAGKGQSQMEYSYTAIEDCYVKICFKVKYRERTYSAELNHFRYEPIVKMSFSMFEKWGVIGDSFASGVFYDNEMQALDNHLQKSWAQILARESGNKCENFSMGGLYCGSWLSNTARGLPFMLSESAKELYIIALGINDVSKLGNDQPLGTISDMNVDYSQNPYTFYGNYGKIIGNIKTHAPKAKIILSTIPYNGESAMQINNAIISIANHFELPCLMVHADKFFRSEYYWDNFEQDHPKSFMYGATANAYNRLICESLKNDTAYWGDTFN